MLPVVDLSGSGGAGDFSKWVKASPTSNLVYEAFGKMRIARFASGCLNSAGGIRVWQLTGGDLMGQPWRLPSVCDVEGRQQAVR